MTAPFTRRDFLKSAAGATALGLGGCLSSDNGSSEPPFDTVVVLMMENRSFDHMLGWLPGADGRHQGLTYPDRNGVPQATWPLDDDVQGCDYCDPDHTWRGIARQYNDGACDGFLQTALVGDTYPIGYYVKEDLPVLSVLAENYTTFDNYFCSMQGPTWENRLYQLTGRTQVEHAGWLSDVRPCGGNVAREQHATRS